MAVSQLIAMNEPSFARHETFHPRYGWLRKAVDRSAADPQLFAKDDATVELGVGKNMVNAIRYWGQAFKLLEQAPNPGRPRMPHLVPSVLGTALFSEDGWDPYIESPGTLWVLHWWLLAPKTKAPVWWIVFNSFNPIQFSDAALARFAISTIDVSAGWTDVLEASVKKDVDCLIRMYSPRKAGQATDDLIDCPFRELGLIEPVPGESRTHRFVVGAKPTLPDQVVAYASVEFMARGAAASTITLARLAQDTGSPGRVFKLTEGSLGEALTRFAASSRDVQVAEPGGVKQLVVSGNPAEVATKILQEYYAQETGSKFKAVTAVPAAPTAADVSDASNRHLQELARKVTTDLPHDRRVKRLAERLEKAMQS